MSDECRLFLEEERFGNKETRWIAQTFGGPHIRRTHSRDEAAYSEMRGFEMKI